MNDDTQSKIQRGKDKPNWVPLESNPDSLNNFAHSVGLPAEYSFVDCFGLDPELLGFVPRPVYGFILLFPYDNPAIKEAKKERNKKLEEGGQPPVDCFWMKQHIGNACGTIAVVHSILNNREDIKLEQGSLLEKYYNEAKPLAADDRCYLLGGWNEIKNVHRYLSLLVFFVSFPSSLKSLQSGAASIGQTEAPAANADVNYHFVAFTEASGHVVEFDGGKRSHVVHKECSKDNFVEKCAEVIQEEYFAKDPAGNFSIIILCKTPN